MKILSEQNSIMGIKRTNVKYESGLGEKAILGEGESKSIKDIMIKAGYGKNRIRDNGRNGSRKNASIG